MPEYNKHEAKEPRGSAIPGSRYLRDYCEMCGEPMRVTQVVPRYQPLCEMCVGRRAIGYISGRKLSDSQYHGSPGSGE